MAIPSAALPVCSGDGYSTGDTPEGFRVPGPEHAPRHGTGTGPAPAERWQEETTSRHSLLARGQRRANRGATEHRHEPPQSLRRCHRQPPRPECQGNFWRGNTAAGAPGRWRRWDPVVIATAGSSWVPAPLLLPATESGSLRELGGRQLGTAPPGRRQTPGGNPPWQPRHRPAEAGHRRVPGVTGTPVSPTAARTRSGSLCKQRLAKVPLGWDPRGTWQPALPSPACPRPCQSTEPPRLGQWGPGAPGAAPARAVGGSAATPPAGAAPGNNPRSGTTCASRLAGTAAAHGALPGDGKNRRD